MENENGLIFHLLVCQYMIFASEFDIRINQKRGHKRSTQNVVLDMKNVKTICYKNCSKITYNFFGI